MVINWQVAEGGERDLSANLTSVIARHPCLHEDSAVAWAMELILAVHSRRSLRPILQRQIAFRGHALRQTHLEALVLHGIDAKLQHYGRSFAAFERDLGRHLLSHPNCWPIVSMPGLASLDGPLPRLLIQPAIFLAGPSTAELIFIRRGPGRKEACRMTLSEARQWHADWRSWPAVLPSALLSVLWHRPSA